MQFISCNWIFVCIRKVCTVNYSIVFFKALCEFQSKKVGNLRIHRLLRCRLRKKNGVTWSTFCINIHTVEFDNTMVILPSNWKLAKYRCSPTTVLSWAGLADNFAKMTAPYNKYSIYYYAANSPVLYTSMNGHFLHVNETNSCSIETLSKQRQNDISDHLRNYLAG